MSISNDLAKEKYTSIFDFANFVPYVFAEKGVYDYSGKRLFYSQFSKIINANNELNNQEFKSIFEDNEKALEIIEKI